MKPSRRDAPLWVITCFFNPGRYVRRIENYLEFRRRLAVPLVTVELSFDGRFALPADAADILLRVPTGAVLWQKERLLNLAWRHVPATCQKIAWLDADVFFASDDWAEATAALLDEHPLVLPFTRVAELRRDTMRDAVPAVEDCDVGYSLLHRWSRGERLPGVLAANVRVARIHTGLACGARREVLEDIGFYDACVIGSGNRAMFCAALDRTEDAIRYLCMGEAWADHYRAWAVRYLARVKGDIGSLDATIFHLWHGDVERRRYAERHELFAAHGFDPGQDVAVGPDGAWVWASPKPDMHALLERYFAERREDG
jgi:hypothetical protein